MILPFAISLNQAHAQLTLDSGTVIADDQNQVQDTINIIMTYVIGILIIVAIGYIIYGGYKFISGGEAGAKEGKTILTYVIIGLIVIFLARALVKFIVNTFTGTTIN